MAEKRRADAAEAEAARLREELAQLKAPKEEPKDAAEPVLRELVEDHTKRKAAREFQQMENEFRREQPDYEDISRAYGAQLATSVKIQNPRMSDQEVIEKTQELILRKAGTYYNQGLNPVEELYYEALDAGVKAEPAREEKQERKPDMAKVAANRARNAGMAAASGGGSGGQLTPAAYMDMTVAERMKISKAERDRLTRRHG
jgi:hypothetical protein